MKTRIGNIVVCIWLEGLRIKTRMWEILEEGGLQ